jgi:predicted RNA-binding Zn-ribbon protein involved in translation (DUF1610 family)
MSHPKCPECSSVIDLACAECKDGTIRCTNCGNRIDPKDEEVFEDDQ